ncbi:stalk domain-containing protein [Paenibacillus graminis]|uniref:Copper amine oxidase-like N-terminal domain-containing protein n=1 Tax=Paenibacillus graminis TaxID=189425 RepID=A0A089M8F4_9BACL|nr:stalk domain-containing protein [Paenibacillus graminis]AIQ69522.1 hypothetical protein PGRAT_19205 [Paenibacillus graminis]
MKKAIIGLVAGMLIGSAGMAAAATTPTVQAVLAKFTISIDGQKQTLKNDPLVYKGTTYLPVREVAEMTGYALEFDNSKKFIDFKSKGGTNVTTSQVENEINLSEWISAKKLVEDYAVDISAASGKIRDISFELGDKKIVFSMPGQLVNDEYTSVDGMHTAIVKDGTIYLSKEAASYLGVNF